MKPYYQDPHITIYNMDCLDGLLQLEAESVQCVVTSPPYWCLRKYEGEQERVWGDNHCEHEWGDFRFGDTRSENFKHWSNEGSGIEAPHVKIPQGSSCQLCGAWRGSFGLEPTPEMYVEHTIEFLRAIRRVLRKDGVVFWNIGDSYNGSGGAGGDYNPGGLREGQPKYLGRNAPSLKPKDLCLIPFRVAIAAQDDGWWVRSIIIWAKPNPMPESVNDRPTNSHEYILMLTKSSKYYWDQDAVRETIAESVLTDKRLHKEGYKTTRPERGYPGGPSHGSGLLQPHINGRNLRSVWDFPTQPYPEAHFAVFPEALPERCIKAATSEKGNCSKCGMPWERETTVSYRNDTTISGRPAEGNYRKREGKEAEIMGYAQRTRRISETLGWHPSCQCDAESEPALVLDPFSGAATTLWVAKKLNRRAIGFDTSEEYCKLALERNRQQVML